MKYYAKLNENEICTEIVSTKKDLKGIRGFVEIPDYNETVIYRKWEGNQWSSDRYEPAIEAKFQEKIQTLENETDRLGKEIKDKNSEINQLTSEIQILSGTLADLMEHLVGGAE